MEQQDLAILYSGGRDSLSLYAISMLGRQHDIKRPRNIHLLHMLNGMSRFHDFPEMRYMAAEKILKKQLAPGEFLPKTAYIELDTGRLFQGVWLDRYEELMPRFNGKNLVCVACKLAMHIKAVIYCVERYVPLLLAGYASRQDYYPEQNKTFIEYMGDLSAHFGITTKAPLFDEFDDPHVTRHLLEDFGLPSTGGGERKCLFCQTLTTATEKDTAQYLEAMIPVVKNYIEDKLAGNVKAAAEHFPPGNRIL